VSSYYHAANPHGRGVPFDTWAFAWINGLFEHGRWSDHVAGWRAEALGNPEQILWVRYEDLTMHAEREVRRIATFLGVQADDALIRRTGDCAFFFAMLIFLRDSRLCDRNLLR
jgi:hypothetical protein